MIQVNHRNVFFETFKSIQMSIVFTQRLANKLYLDC